MDFFQHRYYRTTKNLMSIVGQWPYMSTRTRCGFFAVMILFSSVPAIAMTMTILKYYEDWDMFLHCISMTSFGLFSFTKILTLLGNSAIMLKLLNRIRTDWIVWAGEREVQILHDYTEQGRKYVNVYTVLIYSGCYTYLTVPILPTIIDVVLHNGSEPGRFPVPVYIYHLDVQKYYFYIIAYIYATGFVFVTVAISLDSMLIGYVQHCCGIFAALGHKLQSFGKNKKIKGNGDIGYIKNQRNTTLEYLIFTCIVRHNDAIEYADLIETIFSWTFLITMLFRLAIVCISGFQVVTRMNKPQETIEFLACGLSFTLYVYIESYLAQVLLDHSVSIRYYIHNSQWYSMPLKVQKLLLMMTMRCNISCQLTAGKMVNISVESFAVFLKAVLSYLTILCSV